MQPTERAMFWTSRRGRVARCTVWVAARVRVGAICRTVVLDRIMSRTSFYRIALWLPLLVPLPFVGLGILLPELFLVPAVLLGGSLAYASPTYPLFAVVVYWRLRHEPVRKWERSSLWLPLAYAPLCGAGVAFVYTVAGEPKPVGAMLSAAGDVALVALVFGYAYVLLVRLIAARLPFTPDSPVVDALSQ